LAVDTKEDIKSPV